MDKNYYRMTINDGSKPQDVAETIPGSKVYHDTVYLPEDFVKSDDPFAKWLDEQDLISKRPTKESKLDDGRINFDQITSFYMDKYDADDSRLVQWSKNAASWMAGKAQAAKEELNASMTTKLEVVGTMIESKLLLHERMLGYIDDSEFAQRLAEDANVRKTVNVLCQQVLQPTPVTSIPKTSNSFINFGGGISAYWNEMQKKLPIEIENVSEIENILMSINAGLDKNMEPDTRKKFLMEAGLTEEQVKTFVTDADYAEYEAKAIETVRKKVMEDLGIEPGAELSEAEQMTVDAMVEERMIGAKMCVTLDNYEISFEDIYGISPQDMYELFGDTPESMQGQMQPPQGMDEYLELSDAKMGYFDILNGTLEDNMALFEELRQMERNESIGLSLTEEDLQFATAPMSESSFVTDDVPGDIPDYPGITEDDLAFAEQYGEYDFDGIGQ